MSNFTSKRVSDPPCRRLQVTVVIRKWVGGLPRMYREILTRGASLLSYECKFGRSRRTIVAMKFWTPYWALEIGVFELSYDDSDARMWNRVPESRISYSNKLGFCLLWGLNLSVFFSINKLPMPETHSFHSFTRKPHSFSSNSSLLVSC